jgi:anti-sigma regulatory factor (Ser/Thr protein kinase)
VTDPSHPLAGHHPRYDLCGRADCVGLGLMVRRQARCLGWSPRDSEELGLVVVELGTNAVRHGNGGQARLELDGRHAMIEVADNGPGFPPWVLERQALGLTLERIPPVAGRGGLGAGLDSVRRLSDAMVLANRGPRGGALARAVRLRESRSQPGGR